MTFDGGSQKGHGDNRVRAFTSGHLLNVPPLNHGAGNDHKRRQGSSRFCGKTKRICFDCYNHGTGRGGKGEIVGGNLRHQVLLNE